MPVRQASAGVVGPQGPKGYTGVRGYTGPRGATGPRGKMGPRGKEGPPGIQGVKGADGMQGASGAPGRQGARGPAGPRGRRGREGPVAERARGGRGRRRAPPGTRVLQRRCGVDEGLGGARSLASGVAPRRLRRRRPSVRPVSPAPGERLLALAPYPFALFVGEREGRRGPTRHSASAGAEQPARGVVPLARAHRASQCAAERGGVQKCHEGQGHEVTGGIHKKIKIFVSNNA